MDACIVYDFKFIVFPDYVCFYAPFIASLHIILDIYAHGVTVKKNLDGSFEWYKACLVLNGANQQTGVDMVKPSAS